MGQADRTASRHNPFGPLGGLRRLRMEELSAAQLRHVEALFEDSVFPVITPVAVPPTFIE